MGAILTEIRISHLRSFGHETVLRLRTGLNVLCGANGSGKSNALDAILFALVQEPSLLRVRSWAELASRARAGPCAVRLTFTSAVSSEPRLILMAHVKEDASRAFKINGAAAATCQVVGALLELGIDASMPSFCVRQHSASRPIDDAVLTRLLQQASGASQWSAAAALSRAQLIKECETLTRVRADIGGIEALLEREREAHTALKSLLSLRRRERRGRASMATLAARLADVAQRTHAASLAGGRERCSSAQRALSEIEAAASDLSMRLQAASATAKDAESLASAEARTARQVAEAAAEVEGELLHAAVLAEEARREHVVLEGLRARDASGAHERHLASRRQLGALRASREAAAEAEAASAEVAAASKRLQAAASGGWLVDGTLESLRQQTQERLSCELQVAGEARAAAAEAAARAEEMAEEASERAAALAAENARLGSCTEARQAAEARAAAAAAQAEAIDARLATTLPKAVAEADAAAASANERLRQAAAPLRRIDRRFGGADGGYASVAGGATAAAADAVGEQAQVEEAPSLCSVLELAEDDPRLPQCVLALEVLAGRHLGVRLTPSAAEALPLLEQARRRGEDVRVWPLASLRPHDHSHSHALLQRRYGAEAIVPPCELVAVARSPGVPSTSSKTAQQQWRRQHSGQGAQCTASTAEGTAGGGTGGTGARDGGDDDEAVEAAEAGHRGRGPMWAAVEHAFGSALIVSTDELATALLRTHGVARCVTFAGTVHQPGRLQGGYREAAGQRVGGFAALLAYQQAAAAAATANEHAARLGRAHATLDGASRTAATAAAAVVAEARSAGRLAQLHSAEECEREEECTAALGLAEQVMDEPRWWSLIDRTGGR